VSSIWSWFRGSKVGNEIGETLDLVSSAKSGGPLAGLGTEEEVELFVVDLIFEICDRRNVTPSIPLGRALVGALRALLVDEGLVVEIPDEMAISSLTMEERFAIRASLRQHVRFRADSARLLPLWRETLVSTFSGMLEYLPLSAFVDAAADGTAPDDSVVLPEANILDLCDNLPEALDRLLITFYSSDLVAAHVFDPLRERFDRNARIASGIEGARQADHRKVQLPSKHRNQSPEFLVRAYLQGTPFLQFFQGTLPFAIPFPARFEHTHIVGGTGHGKTQLLQFLINHDLVCAAEDGRSVVVIDSQGDLIRTVSQLDYFEPVVGALADRFVLIDPNDVEHPACLNMFDFNRERLSNYAPLDREKILNATVELYEYFFGALLGAELTQRQGVIFKYLARLLIEIPDATIHTLRELMEDGERFRPYMEQLSGTPRSFFATRFFDRQFSETKKQILARLWGVLANTSLERMFSHSRSKIDIFELINDGKIIFINTAKDLLGQEGAAIFGRFFIALISQATVQRAAQLPHQRRPTFVYIDEAQDYFDDNISNLLNQARKYHVGLVFAHQNLDQLGAGLRASVLSSTSIKFAGGVSAKDAAVLDSELRCESEFLLSQRKRSEYTAFACHIRNYTERAVSVTVPLGYVESLPRLEDYDWADLIDENRLRYTAPAELPVDVSIPTSRGSARQVPVPEVASSTVIEPDQVRVPEPAPPMQRANRLEKPLPSFEPPKPGRGGQRHKYLQGLIKGLGEKLGFLSSIEEPVLGGRIDVSLVRGELKLAFEISVTTGSDQEFSNIEKCIDAGYTHVALVTDSPRQVKVLQRFIESNLAEEQRGKVRYLIADEIVEYLNSFGEATAKEQTVLGYKVRTTQKVLGQEDAEARRKAIGGVIARSLASRPKE
jgi:hypothetical protein